MDRRDLLQQMGTGLVLLTVDTAWGQVSPARARAQSEPFRILTAAEAATLEAFGETLLPGAQQAGIAHYVDDQLARDNPMLLLKYLDWTATSFVDFYRQSLASLQHLSYEKLTPEQKTALVREISQGNPKGWTGPPAPLFFFVARNDAVDVYYGTREGFDRLKVPYLAHILPPQKW